MSYINVSDYKEYMRSRLPGGFRGAGRVGQRTN